MSARTSEQAESGALVLSHAQLELLADLIAERLLQPERGGDGGTPLIDLGRQETPDDTRETPDAGSLIPAGALAELLGTSRAWVYEHGTELGAIRLGDGPRARLRFDPEVARERLFRYGSNQSVTHTASNGGGAQRPTLDRRRSLATRRPLSAPKLPSRPRKAAA